jgi:hypothetical protein
MSQFGQNLGDWAGSPFSKSCDGSYITSVYGNSDAYVDGIGVKCADGSDQGSVGGKQGAAYNILCPGGFTGADVRAGWGVDNLNFKCGGQPTQSLGGQGGNPGSFSCPGNQVLMGISGMAGQYLGQISFTCVDKPVAQAVASAAAGSPTVPSVASSPAASAAPVVSTSAASSSGGMMWVMIAVFFFILIIIVGIVLAMKKKRAPKA